MPVFGKSFTSDIYKRILLLKGELSLEVVEILSIHVFGHCFLVLVALFGLILQDGVTEDSHSHIHRFYLSHDGCQGFLDLDNRRVVGHRACLFIGLLLNEVGVT